MKLKIKYILLPVVAAAALTSCHDWLTEDQPGQRKLNDYFTSRETAEYTITGCYAPLAWELNGTYFSEWFIGDVASDDALKGGQNLTDMADVYDIENFKTVASNGMLLQFYRAQYVGISRCNVALQNIAAMELTEEFDAATRDRLLGEAHFLRAYYYFRLVRVFGGVPKSTEPEVSTDGWKKSRASKEDIYELILADLEAAEKALPLRSECSQDDLGHATKGSAQAMLMKVNLYLNNYAEVLTWGKKIIPQDGGKGEYDLCPDYFSQFLGSGENSVESVFEIQYDYDEHSSYGDNNGYTVGTFTVILTRPRNSNTGGVAGWGFNRPTQDLYDEFEAGDPRRDWTIVVPTDSEIENASQEIHHGNRYISRKYLYEAENNTTSRRYEFLTVDHDTRYPLNRKEIRYSDVLLMYAEAAIESGAELDKALEYINTVRSRAGLDPVATADRETLRHERRCELAMEGHRWFDLVRWGIAGDVMMAYRDKYCTAAGSATTEGDDMADFIKGKHELMPIPQEEVRMGGLAQNPGY